MERTPARPHTGHECVAGGVTQDLAAVSRSACIHTLIALMLGGAGSVAPFTPHILTGLGPSLRMLASCYGRVADTQALAEPSYTSLPLSTPVRLYG